MFKIGDEVKIKNYGHGYDGKLGCILKLPTPLITYYVVNIYDKPRVSGHLLCFDELEPINTISIGTKWTTKFNETASKYWLLTPDHGVVFMTGGKETNSLYSVDELELRSDVYRWTNPIKSPAPIGTIWGTMYDTYFVKHDDGIYAYSKHTGTRLKSALTEDVLNDSTIAKRLN